MIDFKDINLDRARSVYLTANTPMYIVRNLRSDPEIVKLHLNNSTEVILTEIEDRLGKLPLDFDDRISPLALLAALSLKQDRVAMLKAARFDGKSYRWYKLVVDSLLQQIRPTSVTNVFAPVAVKVNPTASTSLSSSFQVIELADS
jgi:uncharacterized secreted protein with C-terminal beta-propeller domain